jgi:NADPH:quinone reductase-like Zn-dependent oxidoreductase
MQAIQFSQHGGPDVLQLVELPTPQPAAGQVLIKVAAAGLNYADVLQRLGTYPVPVTLPAVVGYEVAGTVAALGEGVTHLAVGQRVMALLDKGGYAEYAVAAAPQAFPLPDGLGDGEALALLVQGLTAVGLLETGKYKSVLMLAAAGGVGSLLVQVAKNRGIRVVGAVGSEAKKAAVRALGAEAAVSYADADWVAQVRAATDGQGVDAVFDAVGGAAGTAALQALGAGGISVIFGAASGEPTVIIGQELMGAGKSVRGYFIFDDMARLGDYAQELFGYLQAGKLQLAVTTYPAAEVQTAQRDLEARRTQGKIALLF